MKKEISFFMLFMGVFYLSFAQQFKNFIPHNEKREIIYRNSEKSAIDAASIKWWVGSGTNSAILIVNWCDPEIALAWGFRWDDSYPCYVKDMLDSVASADHRFLYDSGNGTYVDDIHYQDESYNLSETGMGWMYHVNGVFGNAFNTQILSNGDIIEWGDVSCAQDWGIWDIPVIAVSDPNFTAIPDDVIIHEDSVKYWIGNGNNQVVFTVNWCDPETALAWGYRFNDDSVLVSSIMEELSRTDSRFHFSVGTYGVDDIRYQDATLNLSVTSIGYMMYNINGSLAQAGYDAQYVKNGDFIKWGDASCAHQDDDWNMSWTTPITPVNVPEETNVVNLYSQINSRIAPNPAYNNTILTVEGLYGMVSLSIFNLNGQLLFQDSFPTNGFVHKEVDISDFLPGIYLLRLQSDKLTQSHKLVIQ